MTNTREKLRTKQLLDFTSNLALLLNSGLSLHASIKMIHSFAGNRQIKELARSLDEGLKRGKSFSELIENRIASFPPLYRGLVNIGDRIGSLSTILPTLYTYLERKKKIRDKIINVSLYPLLILGMLFFGILFLIIFILPKLESLFVGLGTSEAEKAAMGRSIEGFIILGLTFMALCLLLVLSIPLRRHSSLFRLRTDAFLIRIPGLRHVVLSAELFNYTFAVETLTKHGVPLSSAINEAILVCRNKEIVRSLRRVHQELTTGKGLYAAFSGEKNIPTRVKQWVGIGENTGQTDQVFSQLRVYYEMEIDNLTSRLLGMIEPILIIIVGVIVISMIFTFIVPLFSLFGTII